MLNEFGKICKKIRIDRNELLKDMADKLNVTPSYLSAVETGKRNIPDGWTRIIALKYHLTKEQLKELEDAAFVSKNEIKFNVESMKGTEKNLVLAFARKFNDLDNDDREKILSILEKRDK